MLSTLLEERYEDECHLLAHRAVSYHFLIVPVNQILEKFTYRIEESKKWKKQEIIYNQPFQEPNLILDIPVLILTKKGLIGSMRDATGSRF